MRLVEEAEAAKAEAAAAACKPKGAPKPSAAAAKKKTTWRKTAPEALRPANNSDVQSFFAPKPGAAKRPRWRST